MSQRLKSRFTVYQFLVRLRGFKPHIWRRLRVADCTLEELHQTIQLAFGFAVGKPFQFHRRDGAGEEAGSARRPLSADRRLSELVPLDGADFQLGYAAGHGELWRCQVSFEGWILSSFDGLYPFCVEGERGGVPHKQMTPSAFREFLKAWTGPDPWATDRHLAWIQDDPSVIDVDSINAKLQPTPRPTAHNGQVEPLMRVPLEVDEWVPFWDFAAVDDDERERMMCAASRDAIWLYLPEAINSARNLIMAAHQAESSETRDLLDRLVGRLYRYVVFHRLRCAPPQDMAHAGAGAAPNTETDAPHARLD